MRFQGMTGWPELDNERYWFILEGEYVHGILVQILIF